MAQVVKTVLILVRYFNKASEAVYFTVRNGENKEYCVALHKSGNTTCTCKHGQSAGNHAHCYHVTHCQEYENARQSAKPVATYRANGMEHEVVKVGNQLVDTVVHDAEEVAAQAEVEAERKLDAFKAGMEAQYQGDPRVEHEKRRTAPLNGGNAFKLMR